nr:tyrosine-type recombinase/integrase [Maritimibacter sp. DP1N21-5]
MPGLKRYTVNDVNYVYHRASNTRLPAHLPEDHPDFMDAYFDAKYGLKAQPPENVVQPNSVGDVAKRYLTSALFAGLSKTYQDVRRGDISRLLRQNKGAVARVLMNNVRDDHIIADMDRLPTNPANERRKTWSPLCSFALDRKIISRNPVGSVKRRPTPQTRGHIPWSFEDIAMFRAHWPHGTKQLLAFELCFWFGCRISDAIALGDRNLTHDGWFRFEQQKTGGVVHVPFNRKVPDFAVRSDLEELKRSLTSFNQRGATFLETEAGKQRSAKAATAWFSEAAKAAGLPDGRTAHGLRKLRMILHAERGATTHQIAAWSGHESLKEVERYTREADQKRIPTPSVLETGQFY